MTKLNVIFAISSYLPKTYTWVYNQLKFFKDTRVLILTEMRESARRYFPVKGHELFSYPGLEIPESTNFVFRALRAIARLSRRFHADFKDKHAFAPR